MTTYFRLYAALCLAATIAPAGTISLITDPSQLAANDSLSWNQFSDGTSINQTFNAVSAGGRNIGGALAGSFATTGLACDAGYSSCSQAMYNFSLWTSNGSNGAGPLTLAFPGGVSGVGTYLMSNTVGYSDQFAARLDLYNGATLLETLMVTSDEYGDPLYIGAFDSAGPNITSAVFSLATIGVPSTPITQVRYDYDYTAGHSDPAFCAAVQASQFADLNVALQCPQATAGTPYEFSRVIYYPTPSQILYAANVTTMVYGGYDTTDSDPDHLADFYIDTVDFIAAPAVSTPEPGTLPLLGSAALVLAGIHRRKMRSRS